jgi:GR25 family glycosyltransferase involved in LPS biosynthesis
MLDWFERIYVINLPERLDRRRETEAELARVHPDHGAKFFPAIRPDSDGGFGSVGEHGCYLSHLTVWKEAVGTRSVLMLEDDVAFAPDFGQRSAMAKLLPADWDIFYGGHMQLAELKQNWTETGLVAIQPETEFIGTHCYAVNGRALPQIIEAIELYKSRDRGYPDGGKMPIDGAINIARRQYGLRTFAAIPPLANQRASRTDVGELKWFDRNPALHEAVRAARRMKNTAKRIEHAVRHALAPRRD